MRVKNGLFVFIAILILISWHCEENPFGPSPAQHEILIRNTGFSPSTITINAGETVLWRNVSDATHSVDPGTFMNPTDDFVASPNIDAGGEHRITFPIAKTINYYCLLHQQALKEGTIVIQ